MTLLFSSMLSSITKCSHGLLLAQHGETLLHVIATDRSRLILARCVDDARVVLS